MDQSRKFNSIFPSAAPALIHTKAPKAKSKRAVRHAEQVGSGTWGFCVETPHLLRNQIGQFGVPSLPS